MPQDAFTLRLNALELDRMLRGARINKIVQPSKDEVYLLLYTGKRTVKLVLNANASDCGAYFSETEEEPPLVAPNFCMLLRKHLQSAEVLGVSLVGFERILRFRLKSFSDFSSTEKNLYLEVMGKYSNLILTEGENILGALKTTALDMNAGRVIFPGMKYTLPAPQEKADPQDEEALKRALCDLPAEGDLARALFLRVKGIAASTAQTIASMYREGPLWEHVRAFCFSNEISPRVVLRDGVPSEFYARGMSEGVPFETLSEAQRFYYGERRRRAKFLARSRTLSAALSAARKKHEKRLAQILEKRKECEDCEALRKKGELLTAYLYLLGRGMKSCELEDYETGKTVKILLDPALTPAENAQSYFKRYRKQKRTLEAIAPQAEDVTRELDYLASLSAALSSAETEDDLFSLAEEMEGAGLLKTPEKERKKRAPIPFRTYEMMGFTVLAGRNNLQNDRLVRSAAPDDLWLHVQRYHSCHVVIRANGKTVPREVRQFAADICAKFSESSEDRVPVDLCPVKFVKKPKGGKAGFVTYSDFETLAGNPKNAP